MIQWKVVKDLSSNKSSSKRSINQNICSLHNIVEKKNCTKIKNSLARTLFQKKKSEDQGINLVWSYLKIQKAYLSLKQLCKIKVFKLFNS